MRNSCLFRLLSIVIGSSIRIATLPNSHELLLIRNFSFLFFSNLRAKQPVQYTNTSTYALDPCILWISALLSCNFVLNNHHQTSIKSQLNSTGLASNWSLGSPYLLVHLTAELGLWPMMKQDEQTDVAARIAESEKTLNEFDNERVWILMMLECTWSTEKTIATDVALRF